MYTHDATLKLIMLLLCFLVLLLWSTSIVSLGVI